MGYIDATPLKRIAKQPAQRRDNPMAPEDFQAILVQIGEGDPFLFIWHTGCRSQEARHIEPRHVDLDRAVVVIPKEEAKGKRYPRFIHLHGPALEIVQRLMKRRKQGELFRNTRGEPWTKYALCNRIYRLSKVAGIKKTAYDMRHGFCQRLLERNVNMTVVAELMGHADAQMVSTVYSHMHKATDHLKEALRNTAD
jgi:integrase